jgi:hypothetical protein
MDDGSLSGHRKRCRISTNGFTKEDVEKLSKFLSDKYNLKTWLCAAKTKKGVSWELWFDKASSLKITELTKDFVVPSMQYKLFRE